MTAPSPLRVEVIPLPGIAAQVREHLDPAVPLTITSSPAQGVAATLDLAETLAGEGYRVVPHLAARQLSGPEEAARIVERLGPAGIEEVFVIAGDAPRPVGSFTRALDLLRTLRDLQVPWRVGAGAYPEGHPHLGPDAAWLNVHAKAELADVLVTQMCFAADPIAAWLRRLRVPGVDTPVLIGLPGPVALPRLLRIAGKVGVGPSLRMLRHQGSAARHLVGGRWDPAALWEELRPVREDPALGVAGVHLYSFNDLAAGASLDLS